MHYLQSYLILHLFIGQIFSITPLVADWGRHKGGKYPQQHIRKPTEYVSGVGVEIVSTFHQDECIIRRAINFTLLFWAKAS